ncbi:hypothetical protein [Cereibacter johrii]|uniref:hypothetical protein n=1 Tax=Cereibacter johrii TaxID=445629 RepID=UPI000DCB601F|nr:hypothetical protein [Cereibacter johrii]RAZ83430.1 hypothetical protein DDV93_14060 [Cereibacter johrii]
MATKLTYAERMRADGKYPAVLRFENIHPADVAGIIGHAERRIGDLSHIDFSQGVATAERLLGLKPSAPGGGRYEGWQDQRIRD